jgi:hypothetical protein
MANENDEFQDLNDDLFNGGLDEKMDFLKEKSTSNNNDGLYRVDLKLVKDKKKGWKSVIRFLPNLTKDGKVGQSAIEKIAHYVDIKDPKELSGWFDSPKNFGEKRCPLTDLYYNMKNSKNAVLVEKADMLNYSRKYYSYVLILEDEQQPELVGKILIFQYGKTIKDKILAEKNGEISGVPCNPFNLANGKDFVLLAKDIQTGEVTYPDYKMSMFRPEASTISLYSKEKGIFKNAPINTDGKFEPKVQGMIKDFLLDREHELEEFSPKHLTDEQQAKITEISNFLTNKSSSTYGSNKVESKPTSNDFNFESNFNEVGDNNNSSDDEDDFFKDL